MTSEAKQKIVLWYQKLESVAHKCHCESRTIFKVGIGRGSKRGRTYFYCEKCHYRGDLLAMEFHVMKQLFMQRPESRDFLTRDLLINIAVVGTSMLFLLPVAILVVMHSFFWITGVVFCLFLMLSGMSEVFNDQELINMIDKKDDSV